VAHACNPGYSGGRDQKDRSLKPAQANSSVRPYLKKPFTKIGLVEWLKMKTLSSSPSSAKKKKKKSLNEISQLKLLCGFSNSWQIGL
jgi:hypothetical protein